MSNNVRSNRQSGEIHTYVNLANTNRDDRDETPPPPLPARRDKPEQWVLNGNGGSRARDRSTLLNYEIIKEREQELERIHQRSRELMAEPPSRDTSQERRLGKDDKSNKFQETQSPLREHRVNSPVRQDFRDFGNIGACKDLLSPAMDSVTDTETDTEGETNQSSGLCAGCIHCGPTTYNIQVSVPANIEDRLQALEVDKNNLRRQVEKLADQLNNHTYKVAALEQTLDGKKSQLRETEELLEQELVNRSSLETDKLALLTEISGLKLKQTAMNSENMDLRRRLEGLELARNGWVYRKSDISSGYDSDNVIDGKSMLSAQLEKTRSSKVVNTSVRVKKSKDINDFNDKKDKNAIHSNGVQSRVKSGVSNNCDNEESVLRQPKVSNGENQSLTTEETAQTSMKQGEKKEKTIDSKNNGLKNLFGKLRSGHL